MQDILKFIAAAAAPQEIFIVGGAVRDQCLGRQVTDYDFAYTGDATAFARNLAEKLNASFILLDEEHNISRVIYKTGKKNIILDFASLQGKDIESDLNKRDFTLNAMALPLSLNLSKLIDPLEGQVALKNKRIIAVSEENLIEDPARIVRGLRLAIELDYIIDDDTLGMFKKHASRLKDISQERIRDELFKALRFNAYKVIRLMEKTGILEVILPELYNAIGVEQNKYHTLDVYGHISEVVRQMELVLSDEDLITSVIKRYLGEELVTGRSRKSLLKFAAILHDVGKPVVRKQHPQKGLIFWNHEGVGAAMASEISERLVLSKKETNFIVNVVKNHMRPLFLVNSRAGKKSFYKFFNATGSDGIAVILHSIADTRGGKTPDPTKEETLIKTAKELINYYYEEYLPQQEAPLITGSDILGLLPDLPRNKIGNILNKVKELRASGKINNRQGAIAYLRNLNDI